MPVDWTAIHTEFQQGISQRSLATKYGISQAAISKRASKEHWVITPVIIPQEVITETASDDLTIVQKALNDLAAFLNAGLQDLRDHKLFADALSQYIKLKLTIPTEQEQSPYDLRDLLSYCTQEELDIIRPIMAAAAARKQEAEEKIKPIRKIG